jgi:hypothetical protein
MNSNAICNVRQRTHVRIILALTGFRKSPIGLKKIFEHGVTRFVHCCKTTFQKVNQIFCFQFCKGYNQKLTFFCKFFE